MYQAQQLQVHDPSPRSSHRPSQAYSSHSHSPYTSTPATSSVSSGPVQPVKPINFPKPSHVAKSFPQYYDDRRSYRKYDELGNDADYEYVDEDADVAGLTGMDPYKGLQQPRFVRRESQDVEFSHRSPGSGRLRPMRGWEVNVKMPKGFSTSTAKAKAFLQQHRLPNLRSLRRSHTISGAQPPIEFRDSQPVPASVRQQYSELAPTEGALYKSEDGRLAPPPTASTSSSTTPPVSLLDVGLRDRDRRSRTQSVSHTSPSALQAPSLHRRSRSADSRRSASVLDDTVVGHETQQTHGETTLVHHNAHGRAAPTSSWYSHLPRLSSSKPGSSTASSLRTAKGSQLTHPLPANSSSSKPPRTHYRTSKHPVHAVLAPVVRVLQHLQRMPWVAEAPEPRGWIIPYNDPPRIAADFVPHSSARSRFRVSTSGEDADSKAAKDVRVSLQSPSWYRPRAPGTRKELQGLWRGPGGVPVSAIANAYQNYLASSSRRGRPPVGYMYGSPGAYGPPSARSVSSYQGASAHMPMPYAPAHARSISAGAMSAAPSQPGSSYPYQQAQGYTPPQQSASAYPERQASQGHRSNYSSYSGSVYSSPPPVPSKEGLPAYYLSQPQPQVQAQYQYQQQPTSASAYAAPPAAMYIAPSDASSIPSIPSHISSNASGYGSGYGSLVAPSVPVKYVPYTYSYA